MKEIGEVADIIDLVTEIEERFPVNEWLLDDLNIWPLIRFRIVNLINGRIRGFSNRQGRGFVVSFVRTMAVRSQRALRAAAIPFLAGKKSRTDCVVPETRDVVFLSYPYAWVALAGNDYYDRYVDPLRDVLERAGLSTMRINLCPPNRITHRDPQDGAECFADFSGIRANAVVGRKASKEYQALESSQSYALLRDELAASYDINLPNSADMYATLVAMRDTYIPILKSASPKFGITPLYSNMEGLAFILACRACGVPSMDLQHGVQARFNVAYAQWTRVPQNGYTLLPDYFLCWGQKEAALILEWKPVRSGTHTPVIIGNTWLDKWQDPQDSIVSRYDREVRALRHAIARDAHHVLFTLQNTSPPDFVLRAMKAGGDGYWWWIRVHPRFLRETKIIVSLLKEYEIANYTIQEATSLPLPCLLRNLDVHISENSTVTEDAARLGLLSVNWSAMAHDMYPDEIRDGDVLVVGETTTELLDAIALQIERKGNRSAEIRAEGSKSCEDVVTKFQNIMRDP